VQDESQGSLSRWNKNSCLFTHLIHIF